MNLDRNGTVDIDRPMVTMDRSMDNISLLDLREIGRHYCLLMLYE